MCGIVGAVSATSQPVSPDIVRRMCEAIRHRGPDDEGYYFNRSVEDGASVALGMRRLAIIDLHTGHQPITNEDQSVWVVLNGEIYNYRALRAELEARGHRFSTQTDTEVIVHAYEEYGDDVPKRLRGMFAFALWDVRRQRLMLARDRVGKKPLLYSVNAGRLAFASEFQALLAHPDVGREVNPEAIADYLSFLCVPAPQTAFKSIQKLEPAHTLIWQNGEVKIERYWSLDFKSKIEIDEAEAAERTIELLRDAVRVRLMSDVPLGAFLSGGVDSSAVVAFMSEMLPGRVKTFSIGFDEKDFSEIHHARRVAKAFGTEHHEFVVRPQAIEVLPTLVRHYGEPYADSSAIPTYYLAKMTRQHVTVALNGDGGDEAFAGYERYAAMRLAHRYQRLPQLVREQLIERTLNTIPATGASRSRLARARRFAGVMNRPADERYLRWTSAIHDELKLELCTRDFLARTRPALRHVAPWFAGNGEIDVVDRALAADTFNYLPNDLLVKVDIASMAASLEARSPFLDHQVLEFAASLPASFKLRRLTTKALLKRALRGRVPAENLTRAKMGFGMPIGHWFRDELKGYLSDTILSERALRRGYFNAEVIRHLIHEHTSGRRDYAHQLWTLLMLELWHQEFTDK